MTIISQVHRRTMASGYDCIMHDDRLAIVLLLLSPWMPGRWELV